jgi:hypothetical protein
VGDRPLLRRSKVDPANCTLVEWAYARTGSILQAGRVVSYVVKYAAAREALGQDPGVEEYAEWWGEAPRTSYLHQAQFREIFELDNPGALLAAMERQQAGVQERVDLTGLVAA